MAVFTFPTSYRLNAAVADDYGPSIASGVVNLGLGLVRRADDHASHPDLGNLTLLVFSAVLEVVCVSLPGYIIARQGMFDQEKQKFVANLNVSLFTPCLIFTKLASQLTASKLLDLAVIPVIFVVQITVSYLVSISVSKAFRLGKRPANFVTAMGVFGNSNSLPISLVIALSQTLKGLHWDKVPGDNDDEVAARGILYLLIFQQLGQLVRWSWGYHVLLAPANRYEDDRDHSVEEGRYRDEPDLIPGLDGEGDDDDDHDDHGRDLSELHRNQSTTNSFASGERTPVTHVQYIASYSDAGEDSTNPGKKPANGYNHLNGILDGDITSFPSIRTPSSEDLELPGGISGMIARIRRHIKRGISFTFLKFTEVARMFFHMLPSALQTFLSATYAILRRFVLGTWEFMNPPLWAMLAAVIVASIPSVQRLFFEEGTFISNSVTRAVSQSGGVAVPLILVVLGANLARNTLPKEAQEESSEESRIGTKLLVASLISRMLLPTIIMAPLLALAAKYVPVSIVDDPIFVIVCFLLTGAPSALQLAQICQINGVYENVMSKLLFQSYVIWILPSTLILVLCALEVVEWAKV